MISFSRFIFVVWASTDNLELWFGNYDGVGNFNKRYDWNAVDLERQLYQSITRALHDAFPRRPAGAGGGRWSGRENPETKNPDEYISGDSGDDHSVDSTLRTASERNDINDKSNK